MKHYLETTTTVGKKLETFKKFFVVSSFQTTSQLRFCFPATALVNLDTAIIILVFLYRNCPIFASSIISNDRCKTLGKLLDLILIANRTRVNKNSMLPLSDQFYEDLQLTTHKACTKLMKTFFRSLNKPEFLTVSLLQDLKNLTSSAEMVLEAPIVDSMDIRMSLVSNYSNYTLLPVDASALSRGCLFINIEGIHWKIDVVSKYAETRCCPPPMDVPSNFQYIANQKKNSSHYMDYHTLMKTKNSPNTTNHFIRKYSIYFFSVLTTILVAWRCPISDCGLSLCKKHHLKF